MEAVGERRAEMQDMVPDGQGRVRLDFIVPARGLIESYYKFTLTKSNDIQD
jgi:GTP-binding protein